MEIVTLAEYSAKHLTNLRNDRYSTHTGQLCQNREILVGVSKPSYSK